MKFVDLSIFLENNSIGNPNGSTPSIAYARHHDAYDWAEETSEMGTHDGTHMDAPWHFYPTMDADLHDGQGVPSTHINEFPPEYGYGDLVVFDFSHMPDGHLILSDDFKYQLLEMNYKLKEGDIVFIKCGAAPYWGKDPSFWVHGVGVSREATVWLAEQGVHVVGTDGWSWDRPILFQVGEYSVTKNKDMLWEGHRAGAKRAYYQIEKLTNLDKVPRLGAKVYCQPLKIKDASAGYCRVVAVVPDDK